jgi:hypothetical protein
MHENGQVLNVDNVDTGSRIDGLIPRRLLYQFEPYLLSGDLPDDEEDQ